MCCLIFVDVFLLSLEQEDDDLEWLQFSAVELLIIQLHLEYAAMELAIILFSFCFRE